MKKQTYKIYMQAYLFTVKIFRQGLRKAMHTCSAESYFTVTVIYI